MHQPTSPEMRLDAHKLPVFTPEGLEIAMGPKVLVAPVKRRRAP